MVIVHATDLSGDDAAAFIHASALAAASAARLVTVHANGVPDTAMLPDASELARRWARPTRSTSVRADLRRRLQ
jgi:hypothetical protein